MVCGVVNPSERNGRPCMRSLTCKSHSVKLKTAVAGRSRDYAALIAEHQKRREQAQMASTQQQTRIQEVRPEVEAPVPIAPAPTLRAEGPRVTTKPSLRCVGTLFDREFWTETFEDVPDPPSAEAKPMFSMLHAWDDGDLSAYPEPAHGLSRIGLSAFTYHRGFKTLSIMQRDHAKRRKLSTAPGATEPARLPPAMVVAKGEAQGVSVVSHVASMVPLSLRIRRSGPQPQYTDATGSSKPIRPVADSLGAFHDGVHMHRMIMVAYRQCAAVQ